MAIPKTGITEIHPGSDENTEPNGEVGGLGHGYPQWNAVDDGEEHLPFIDPDGKVVDPQTQPDIAKKLLERAAKQNRTEMDLG